MKCNTIDNNNIIDNCQCLQRLSYALKYYSNKDKLEKDWINFCVTVYGHQMLDDYSHLLSTHYQHVEQIKYDLINNCGFEKCSIENCKFSDRHFNREKIEKRQDHNFQKIDIYQQECDSLHFNLFHLFDVGYRFKLQEFSANNTDNTNDDGNNKYFSCVDDEFAQMMEK
eukprot:504724_1